ncbi:hypothetical protein TNCV_3692491 [Trichonephila clavipes]|nr:hypothetical protein TNCV_3692491 [Trichonephila clavipes]
MGSLRKRETIIPNIIPLHHHSPEDCLHPTFSLPWSARFSHLLPFEHIWDHLGWQFGQPMSLIELEVRLHQLWNDMLQDIIRDLNVSMLNRFNHAFMCFHSCASERMDDLPGAKLSIRNVWSKRPGTSKNPKNLGVWDMPRFYLMDNAEKLLTESNTDMTMNRGG